MSDDPNNVSPTDEAEKDTQREQSPHRPLGDYSIDELEKGLSIIGLGRYNLKYAFCISLLLVSSMIEVLGNSVVLPAARCDLGIPSDMMGVIASIPFIGIIMSSYIHGYLIDTRGRKKMAVYTSVAAGCTSFLAAFMPNLGSFVLFKFFNSLWIATPSALPYTFIAEIIPSEHRVIVLTVVNAIQLIGSAFDPFIAWLFVPLDFKVNFGLYMFRPWRLLIIIYALFFLLSAYLISFGPESPKFLLSRGNPEAALKVLQTMYAANTRKPPEDFPIKSLHAPPLEETANTWECMKRQTKPFLEPKYYSYLLLNGFLLFGIFVISNGVYINALEAIDRVLSYEGSDQTACEIIMESQMPPMSDLCDDAIDSSSIMINCIAQLLCAMIGIAVSLTIKYTGKYYVLCSSFVIIGTCCIFVNLTKHSTIFIILMSLLPLITLAIGPINLYCLKIYPVHMRGMAVMLCMMVGRVGSLIGTSTTGVLIDQSCNTVFYLCALLLYACAVLTMYLPGVRTLDRLMKLIANKRPQSQGQQVQTERQE